MEKIVPRATANPRWHFASACTHTLTRAQGGWTLLRRSTHADEQVGSAPHCRSPGVCWSLAPAAARWRIWSLGRNAAALLQGFLTQLLMQPLADGNFKQQIQLNSFFAASTRQCLQSPLEHVQDGFKPSFWGREKNVLVFTKCCDFRFIRSGCHFLSVAVQCCPLWLMPDGCRSFCDLVFLCQYILTVPAQVFSGASGLLPQPREMYIGLIGWLWLNSLLLVE